MKKPHEKFCWYEACLNEGEGRSAEERYRQIVDWSSRARGINPTVFDELSAWLLRSGEWNSDEIAENGKYLMDQIIGKFREQNRLLRIQLEVLKPSGLVNEAVFDALDRFELELSGETQAEGLKESVSKVFCDFSAIRNHKIREDFAGGITGPTGTDTVETFGYLNVLKDCDASVQWTLFMPDLVSRQQNGFRVERFEYLKYPGLRFIGTEKEPDAESLQRLSETLNSLNEYRSGFDYDAILLHHLGRGVDVEPCHVTWGRFMAAGTPVPEGFVYIDFVPQKDGNPGIPYLSQFACAQFVGDPDSMHNAEGFDCNAMYDVTRNIILGQNVPIPYPDKYWTAEVYTEGFGTKSTTYLFSVE
ncbi:MAG: hypothetical protein HFH88_17040 [Lachnospiraceae bacterium]|nr:hypothetical protein [Lachnospiraceae bacterium]